MENDLALLRLHVMSVAVRALMETHPEPAALRQSWDRLIAAEFWGFYGKQLASQGGIPDGTREQMLQEQARWETWIPASGPPPA